MIIQCHFLARSSNASMPLSTGCRMLILHYRSILPSFMSNGIYLGRPAWQRYTKSTALLTLSFILNIALQLQKGLS